MFNYTPTAHRIINLANTLGFTLVCSDESGQGWQDRYIGIYDGKFFVGSMMMVKYNNGRTHSTYNHGGTVTTGTSRALTARMYRIAKHA